MDRFLSVINRISRFLNVIAGAALTFLMVLTIIDVVLRGFKTPIVGTYELVAFSGAVVIGFAIPRTSWLRAHIFVDFFILKLSRRVRNGFNLVTRSMVFVLFFLIGWNLIKYGMDLQRSGEVSLTLQMPFYPVAYGVGLCSFVQCLVMVCDMVKVVGGKYDE